MQIFRIDENHIISARFLDNRRLSKQVLELYQIIRVCLAEMGIINTNTRYLSHPIVKLVYNNGTPYLLDALSLLKAFDQEHQRRGGKRSESFNRDLAALETTILKNKARFEHSSLPPYFVYGEKKVSGREAYDCYKSLLYEKWNNDKIPPRCNITYRKD